VRTLQFLRYFESIGVLIIVLMEMVADVMVFFVFIMIFSLAFGFAMAVLLPGNVNLPANHIFSSEPIYSTFWGLFGSDNLDNIEEYVPQEAKITNFFAPLLLWLYMLIATIVLVNLLIAQMSNTYETVMQDSKIRWLFARADIFIEFKDSKAPLPPPLNLLWMLYSDVPKLLKKAMGIKVPQKWFGFKLIRPPKGPGLTQSLLQSCELDALRTCLESMVKEENTTMENRVSAKIAEQLSIAKEENTTRFEALNGRLDKLDVINGKIERRLTRIFHVVESSGRRDGGHPPPDGGHSRRGSQGHSPPDGGHSRRVSQSEPRSRSESHHVGDGEGGGEMRERVRMRVKRDKSLVVDHSGGGGRGGGGGTGAGGGTL